MVCSSDPVRETGISFGEPLSMVRFAAYAPARQVVLDGPFPEEADGERPGERAAASSRSQTPVQYGQMSSIFHRGWSPSEYPGS